MSDNMLGRIMMAISRAIITRVDDSSGVQSVQAEALAGEAMDGVERFQNYGLTSVPHPEAEAVMLCVGGLRSHAIVVAVEDRRYRLTGLSAGEVALHDDQGQVIRLARDGIAVTSPFKIVVDAPEIHLGGEGGPAVARIGDAVGGGVVTAGSAKVFAA